ATSCFATRRLCSARGCAVPDGWGRSHLAGGLACSFAFPLRRCSRARRGLSWRPPTDALSLLARRTSARARPRSLAGPLYVPARGEATAQLPWLAVRPPLLAAGGGVRARRRLERLAAPPVRPRRTGGVRVAARARAAARTRARRRARVRHRALSRGTECRSPPRSGLDPDPADALGVRARTPRKRLWAAPLRGCSCLDPLVRAGASFARRHPVLCRVCALPNARPTAARRGCGRDAGRDCRRHRRAPDRDQELDAVRRPLPRRDLVLLGPGGGLRVATRGSRPQRAIRLPRVGDTAGCAGRPRGAPARPPIRTGSVARARCRRPHRARIGHTDTGLLGDLARPAAFPFSPRTVAPAAACLPLRRRTLCVCARADAPHGRDT